MRNNILFSDGTNNELVVLNSNHVLKKSSNLREQESQNIPSLLVELVASYPRRPEAIIAVPSKRVPHLIKYYLSLPL